MQRSSALLFVSLVLIAGTANAHAQVDEVVEGSVVRVFRLFETLPRDDESFKNIFREDPRANEMTEIDAVREKLERRFDRGHVRGKDDLEARLRERAQVTVVIGHNENGLIRFGDGSHVAIEELSQTKTQDEIMVILACNSSDHVSEGAVGVSRPLTYEEAAEIAGKFQEYFKRDNGRDLDLVSGDPYRRESEYFIAGKDPAVEKVTLLLEQFDADARKHYIIKRLVKVAKVVGVAAAGAAVVEVTAKVQKGPNQAEHPRKRTF